MTRGVVVRLIHMFGTKWGQIDVAGQNRECFFNRASLLSPEDFDQLNRGSKVEFEEKADPTHGTRAHSLVIVTSVEPTGAEQAT